MTLIDAVLTFAKRTNVSELIDLPVERKKQLGAAISKLKAEQVPLEDWNTLLVSFGGESEKTQKKARTRLIRLLTKEDSGDAEADSQSASEASAKPKAKSKPLFWRIWNTATTVLVIAAAVLAIALVGVRLIGVQVFTVLSGSMEPVYHVGSLIYVKSVDPAELAVGDDITFMLDAETVATHRIVGIVPDENDPLVLRFRTKGVANEHEDGTLVHWKNIVGKPIFTIPYLGYAANFIQHPPGTYIALSVGAILLLLVFLPDLFSEDSGGKKTEKNGKSRKTQEIRG